MPIGQPRRIFAPNARRRANAPVLRLALAAGLGLGAVSILGHVAAGMGAGAARPTIAMAEAATRAPVAPPDAARLPAPAAAQSVAPAAAASPGQHLTGIAAVVDGDTLRLAGQVIRLDGVHAPHRGDSCVAGTDCAAAAATRLASLINAQPLSCDLHGADEAGHPLAVCATGAVAVNDALTHPATQSGTLAAR